MMENRCRQVSLNTISLAFTDCRNTSLDMPFSSLTDNVLTEIQSYLKTDRVDPDTSRFHSSLALSLAQTNHRNREVLFAQAYEWVTIACVKQGDSDWFEKRLEEWKDERLVKAIRFALSRSFFRVICMSC